MSKSASFLVGLEEAMKKTAEEKKKMSTKKKMAIGAGVALGALGAGRLASEMRHQKRMAEAMSETAKAGRKMIENLR